MPAHRASSPLRRAARAAVVALTLAGTVAAGSGEVTDPTSPPTPGGVPDVAQADGTPAPAASSPQSTRCRDQARTDAAGRTWHWCLPPRSDTVDGASVNGWPPSPEVTRQAVPGTTVALDVVDGPGGDLLAWFALAFDRRVEGITGRPGTDPDDWGFHARTVRGEAHLVSDHASGTAIDLNALCHGLGTTAAASFTPAEVAAVRGLLAEAGGVIEWGADYAERGDPMHFSLAPGTTTDQAQAALDAVGGPAPARLVASPSRPGCAPPT